MTEQTRAPSNLLAGRYRLLERRDRTGTAWRARDEVLHRDVTVSEVRLPPPGPHRDWLLGQVRAAADLRHPGVVTLHDVISAPDRMWLVLESIDGRSLLQTVRAEGPLAPERAADVGLRVLDALTAAHGRGVRLAATPDTVLLGADGRVVLTGVAGPGSADDLRDLGATLFTALEGRTPATGSLPPLVDGMPLADPDPTTGTVTYGPLAPLVEGLLAADPAHRPDATSVRLTLERIAPTPPASRRRHLVTAAVAAVALLAGAAFWLWPRASGPATSPITLPASFATAPDPCSLISTEQAAELSLTAEPRPAGKTECHWGTEDRGLPDSLQYTLTVEVLRYPTDERAHADHARFMASEAKRDRTSAGSPLRRVRPVTAQSGIAAEAYTFAATNGITYNSGVVFRAANLVVAVQYQRGGGAEDPGDRTRSGALRATRWVLEALSRTR
ncbi:serine/threonine-protein kinase [Streptosporangium sandarakinum]|uniref:serine/threonine-protein kinase n=1 Tax=Streptosporangium sandarakinum TaxID=1260955 RepID=UPI003435805E